MNDQTLSNSTPKSLESLQELLPLFRCPSCQSASYALSMPLASLDCKACGSRIPVLDGLPDFTPCRNMPTPQEQIVVPHHKNTQHEFWFKKKSGRRTPDHPVVCAVFSSFASSIRSILPDAKSMSVLDIGCGNGFFQTQLESVFRMAVGVDAYRSMLDVNPCQHNVVATAQSLPFVDQSFDVVTASNLFHHLLPEDRLAVLLEMKRVARCVVILIEPNARNPLMFSFACMKREERMVLSFTRPYMDSLFENARFSTVHSDVRGWLTPNCFPSWFVPIGLGLDSTWLRHFGFYIFSFGFKTNADESPGASAPCDPITPFA